MSDYFDRIERQIVQRVEEGVPRTSRARLASGHLAVAAAVLVVVAVAGVFLAAGGSGGGAPSPATHPAITLTFTASPANSRAIDESVRLLRERLHAVLPGANVSATGDGLTVTLSHSTPGARGRILAMAAPGRLAFYDWEASVLTPNGKTVASQLPPLDPTAVTISQGSGSAAPGDPGAGCLSLQAARTLVGREPLSARAIVVETVGGSDAGYFVLRNDPLLTGSDIVDPHETRLAGGVVGVSFRFAATGRREFQALTATLARRGDVLSGLGDILDQHFAIAVDNKLVTVPSIDFKQYPDGVNARDGADISGNLTSQSAKDLASLLRYGPLPVQLKATG